MNKKNIIISTLIIFSFLVFTVTADVISKNNVVTLDDKVDSYVLKNNNIHIEIFKDSQGYDRVYYPNDSIAIYEQKIVLQEYKSHKKKSWKQIGVPQKTGYYQDGKSIVVWRHYDNHHGLNYNVYYSLAPTGGIHISTTIVDTTKTTRTYRIYWTFDGITNPNYIKAKNAITYQNIKFDFQDVANSWGAITVYNHTISNNGRHADYYFEVGEHINFELDPTITIVENSENLNYTSDLFGSGYVIESQTFEKTEKYNDYYFTLPSTATVTSAYMDISGDNATYVPSTYEEISLSGITWRNMWLNSSHIFGTSANYEAFYVTPIKNGTSKISFLDSDDTQLNSSNHIVGGYMNGTHYLWMELQHPQICAAIINYTKSTPWDWYCFKNLSDDWDTYDTGLKTSVGHAYGFTYREDEEHFYVIHDNQSASQKIVMEYDKAWNLVDVHSNLQGENGNKWIRDITWDGTNFWMVDEITDTLHKYNQDLTPTGFSKILGGNIYAVSSLNGNLYVGDIDGGSYIRNYTKGQSYPSAVNLTVNGTLVFQQNVTLKTSNITSDFTNILNTYLSGCPTDSNGYCSPNIGIEVGSGGGISLGNVTLNYTTDESGAFTILDWWIDDDNIYHGIDNIQSIVKKYIRSANPSSDFVIDGFGINENATTCQIYSDNDKTNLGDVVNTTFGVFCQLDSQMTLDKSGGGTFKTVLVNDNVLGTALSFNVTNSTQSLYTKYFNITGYNPDGSISSDNANTKFENVTIYVTLDDTSFTTDPAILYNILGSWINLNSTAYCKNSYGTIETNWSTTNVGGDIFKVCHTKSGIYKDYFKILVPHLSNKQFKTESSTTTNAPAVSSPYINPEPIYTNYNLTCASIISDQEGDPANVTFIWYVDDIQISNNTYVNIVSGTNKTSILGSGNFTKGQNVNCSVQAFGNDGNSSILQYNLTVQDKPPDITINLTPDPANYSSNLKCNYTYLDEDGDIESSSWIYWYNNNVEVKEFQDQLTVTSANTTYGEFWYCQALVEGTTLNATLVNSSLVYINDVIYPTLNNDTFSVISETVNTAFNIEVDAYDFIGISNVQVEITDPNLVPQNFSMSSLLGNTYRKVFTPTTVGSYNFKFFATDIEGNVQSFSSATTVTITQIDSSPGGGGSVLIMTPDLNESYIKVLTTNLNNIYDLIMVPNEARDLEIQIHNLDSENHTYTLDCEGDFCDHLDFIYVNGEVSAKNIVEDKVRINTEGLKVGDQIFVTLVGSINRGQDGKLDIFVTVTKFGFIGAYFRKLIDVYNIFGFIIPRIIVYLLAGLLGTFFPVLLLRKSKSSNRATAAFFTFLLVFIIVSLVDDFLINLIV